MSPPIIDPALSKALPKSIFRNCIRREESAMLQEYDRLLDLAKKRRTVRKFKPDPLPEGYVEKIIEVARWAPSGFHTQPWEFVVIKNKEVKDAIIKVIDRYAPPITSTEPGKELTAAPQSSFRDAPVFIILLADWRAKIGLPGHPTEKTQIVTNIYNSSLASAFLYMHLAAASLGLASQWYSAVSRPEAEREMNTPPAERVVSGCPQDGGTKLRKAPLGPLAI
jgi:nitroreductase